MHALIKQEQAVSLRMGGNMQSFAGARQCQVVPRLSLINDAACLPWIDEDDLFPDDDRA